MKNIKKIIALISVLFLSQSVFAATWDVDAWTDTSTSLEVKSAPRMISKTSTWVVLEWDKVGAAAAYIVKYSKESVATSTDPNAQYTDETDQVTETWATIADLEPSTAYYFSVVAVDEEGNESNTFSDELNIVTDAVWLNAAPAAWTWTEVKAQSWASLAIQSINVIDNKSLSLEFNTALSIDPVKVKITKTSDNSDLPVSEVTQDPTAPNKVVVKIATVIDPSSSYSLTVISAKDTSGNNIQEGANGVKEFTTLATLPASPELNAASWATDSWALAPIALPATWTKENLIIIAALLTSFVLVFSFRKKILR